jgi:hypothetical protein
MPTLQTFDSSRNQESVKNTQHLPSALAWKDSRQKQPLGEASFFERVLTSEDLKFFARHQLV